MFKPGTPRYIKLDVTADELVESVGQRMIRGMARPARPRAFDVYPIDEIGAEKLRSVIQRALCRDLYDLFRLTGDMSLSLAEIRPLFTSPTRRASTRSRALFVGIFVVQRSSTRNIQVPDVRGIANRLSEAWWIAAYKRWNSKISKSG